MCHKHRTLAAIRDRYSMQDSGPQQAKPGVVEFVALMALLAALDALSIDSMLPALPAMGAELGASGNEPQLVVSALFLGMAAGQLVCGPVSDSFGRKGSIYAFLAIYLAGTAISAFAHDFAQMLTGRVLQGFGAAGPFVVTIAIIRDRYQGAEMARISSFVMSVFILVPIIAPMLGQGILLAFEWRAIFVMLLAFALVVLFWFAIRQPETLPPGKRAPFSVASIWQALAETCGNRQALGYTIIEGLVFGAMLGELSSAQQIFQDLYGQGVMFPVYFALLASGVGVAGLVNGTLVTRFGMRPMTAAALAIASLLSIVFLAYSAAHDGRPPFWTFMAYMMTVLFFVGVLFGNLSALALEPLGDKAGMGATVFGALSTVIALPLGTFVGQAFDMTVLPVTAGIAVLPAAALVVMWWAEKGNWPPRRPITPSSRDSA
jgi:DHA1 family bicyclomycin/chloramphenicol resistance-like MFS transporter